MNALVAKRAASWKLDGASERVMRAQAPIWNLLADHYFRVETEGWHRLPSGPGC